MLIEEKFDVNVFTSLNAQHAIELLMKEDVDLILSDVQMPDIDGFEFADYIKNIERTRDIPIIFITGIYNGEQYKSKGYKLGAIDYITKPINIELFNSKLSIYIDIYRHKKLHEKELESKNALLIHQSKFVAMGEIINMIAHQWRQPLTTLGSILARMNILNEMDKLDKNKFSENYIKSEELIQNLSKTINDFSNFYHEYDLKESLTIEDIINNTLSLIGSTIKDENIDFILNVNDNCKDIKLEVSSSKITQVFLNLFRNSIEEFKNKEIKDKKIIVNCFKNELEKHIYIEINDNAGGIPANIIDKIFEPYFSTKSKNGTGLGLYMSKMILEQNLDATITASNKNDGVSFLIRIDVKNI